MWSSARKRENTALKRKIMPPKDSDLMFLPRNRGKVWLKPFGEPDSSFREVGRVIIDEMTAEAGVRCFSGKNWTDRELSFSFNVDEKSRILIQRMYYQSILDDVARYMRSCLNYSGAGSRLGMNMSKQLFREVWYASHLIANCNPTRYFRGIFGRRFRGFFVFTPSGSIFNKK